MIMDIRSLRKYYLDNRFLFLFLIILLSTSIETRSNDTCEMEFGNELIIKDISYDYKLIPDNQLLGLDCIGTLNIALALPADIKALILERTNPRYNGTLPFPIKSSYPITSTNLSIPNIRWNTCFRICAILKNDERLNSSIYSINDYIDSDDLESLLHQDPSSIEYIDKDTEKIQIDVKNKILEIRTPEPIYLTIYDLHGLCIFNREILNTETIPLNNVTTQLIIVRYKTAQNTITKKILLQ